MDKLVQLRQDRRSIESDIEAFSLFGKKLKGRDDDFDITYIYMNSAIE